MTNDEKKSKQGVKAKQVMLHNCIKVTLQIYNSTTLVVYRISACSLRIRQNNRNCPDVALSLWREKQLKCIEIYNTFSSLSDISETPKQIMPNSIGNPTTTHTNQWNVSLSDAILISNCIDPNVAGQKWYYIFEWL